MYTYITWCPLLQRSPFAIRLFLCVTKMVLGIKPLPFHHVCLEESSLWAKLHISLAKSWNFSGQILKFLQGVLWGLFLVLLLLLLLHRCIRQSLWEHGIVQSTPVTSVHIAFLFPILVVCLHALFSQINDWCTVWIIKCLICVHSLQALNCIMFLISGHDVCHFCWREWHLNLFSLKICSTFVLKKISTINLTALLPKTMVCRK